MTGEPLKTYTVIRERLVAMRQVTTVRATSGDEAVLKAAALPSWEGEVALAPDEGGLRHVFEGSHKDADAAQDARAIEVSIPYAQLHRNDRNERLLEGLMTMLDRLICDASPDLAKEVHRLRLLAEGKQVPEDLDA